MLGSSSAARSSARVADASVKPPHSVATLFLMSAFENLDAGLTPWCFVVFLKEAGGEARRECA